MQITRRVRKVTLGVEEDRTKSHNLSHVSTSHLIDQIQSIKSSKVWLNVKPISHIPHVKTMTALNYLLLVSFCIRLRLLTSAVIVTDDTIVLPGVIITNDTIVLPGIVLNDVQGF